MRREVPIEELIDVGSLGADPHPARVRAALPPGWVLCDDGRHARRDLRLLFRQGWILAVGLVVFGAAGLAIFWSAFPRGWRGAGYAALLIASLLAIGGLVAPGITRALRRR